MWWALRASLTRFRVVTGRLLTSIGLGEDSFLVVLAVLVGVVTAGLAVAFHDLIDRVRDFCYVDLGREFDLYHRHLWMLALIPAAGGLLVGLINRYVYRGHEGSSMIDVMESVGRTTSGVKVRSALEKVVTSAVTIGTGGSAGAEGPIVTIGGAVASGVGRLFGVARQHMPVLTGCGTAAGISAIFNSPLGGVLFTLEVILQDFSVRTFTPVVLASVVANVATQEIYARMHGGSVYSTIFQIPSWMRDQPAPLQLAGLPGFLLLGMCCGLIGMTLTRLMDFTERKFAKLRVSPVTKPAIGGLVLGMIGAFYIIVFGWFGPDATKPVRVEDYPMPSFFGDGYGVVQQLLTGALFTRFDPGALGSLFAFIIVAKLLGTCLTLGSGGSGGVIAPSLFLGACTGGLLGLGLERIGWTAGLPPQLYALVGMGAVLAAVVHAPLAAIVILLDVTRDARVPLPAMLATIVATGLARLLFPDSIYTLGLRRRGAPIGAIGDLTLLRRLTVEQVDLEPASVVRSSDPFQRVLDLRSETGSGDFVVVDRRGDYCGMVVSDDIQTALMEREAVPLLLVGEVMRPEVPVVRNTDDLSHALDTFARHDVEHLPVAFAKSPGRVIGLMSRGALMRRYQQGMGERR
jgi:chloride channel protein, CIC family